MIFASSDLGIQVDYGPMTLQRYENGAWCDYRADGLGFVIWSMLPAVFVNKVVAFTDHAALRSCSFFA